MNTTNNGTQVSLDIRTQSFLTALRAMEEAEDKVLSAFTDTYGEDMGFDFTQKLPFDVINAKILECMRIVILENQRENPSLV